MVGRVDSQPSMLFSLLVSCHFEIYHVVLGPSTPAIFCRIETEFEVRSASVGTSLSGIPVGGVRHLGSTKTPWKSAPPLRELTSLTATVPIVLSLHSHWMYVDVILYCCLCYISLVCGLWPFAGLFAFRIQLRLEPEHANSLVNHKQAEAMGTSCKDMKHAEATKAECDISFHREFLTQFGLYQAVVQTQNHPQCER